MNRDPGRSKHEQQSHQAQSRQAQQAHLFLALHQMLILTLRSRNRVVDVFVGESMRHQQQSRAVCQRSRGEIETLTISQQSRLLLPPTLQERAQFLSLRIRNRRFAVRQHFTTCRNDFDR